MSKQNSPTPTSAAVSLKRIPTDRTFLNDSSTSTDQTSLFPGPTEPAPLLRALLDFLATGKHFFQVEQSHQRSVDARFSRNVLALRAAQSCQRRLDSLAVDEGGARDRIHRQAEKHTLPLSHNDPRARSHIG